MNSAGSELEELRPKRIGFRINQVDNGVSVEEPQTDDDRDEKPWQRVIFEITKKGLHLYEPVKSVPSIFIILLLGYYCMLAYWTQLIEDQMPNVVTSAEVPSNSWDVFSEESARQYLNVIIGDQPRVSGTPYHLQKTEELYALVNNIASQASTPVVTDWQIASNDFLMNLYNTKFVNYYKNVSNIIAVLEGESGFRSDGTTGPSLLVNCHYDSVPFALGASDNAVFCAVLAESLSRLSKRTSKFKNNVIFLFNGAEENTLQGSHAFLAHPWARGVTTVINLDSAGMNGKPSVFQVTDPRMLQAYSRGAYRPSAQGMGEFLFSSGIIPSDTDFRIFREFADIQGIDIAFTKWGHVYHTRYDHPDLIKEGVIQNAGDTVLASIIAAADMAIDEKASPTPLVYVDYLTLFMVTLSRAVALAVDILIALLAMLSVGYYVWLAGPRMSTVRELSWAILGRFLSVLAGVTLTVFLAGIMILSTVQMRYLTQPWVVVPMFWLPYLVGAVAAGHLFDRHRTKKSGLNRSIRALQAMAATRLVLSIGLLVMAAIPAASALRYIVSVPLLFMTVSSFVSLTVVRYVRMEGWRHLILEAALSTPAAMFLSCLPLRMLATMLPTMARSAGDYPDVTIGLLCLGLAVLMGVLISGVELLFSRRRMYLPLGVLLLFGVVTMLVPFSPYQDQGPSTQRHSWFHSEMVRFDSLGQQTSRQHGVVVSKLDAYSTSRVSRELAAAGVHLQAREDLSAECAAALHCGLPLYRVPFGGLLRRSMMLYTSPPAPFSPSSSVSAIKNCTSDSCAYDFTIAVTPHNLVTLWPREGVNLTGWSFKPTPQPTTHFLGRPVYIILYSVATYSPVLEDLKFSVTVQANATTQQGPLLDVAHHAHKIYNPELFTTEYKALLAAMPGYFNIATFISSRKDYMF